MLNILYINGNSEVFGGGEQLLITLLKNLDRDKFRPVLIIPADGPLRTATEELDVKVYISPLSSSYPWLSKINCYRLLSGLKERVSLIAKIIEIEDIGLVHSCWTFVPDGGFAAKERGIPHLWHIQNRFLLDHQIFECLPYHNFMDEMTDKIMAVSNAVKSTLLPYIPEGKIEVIHCGIDLNKFKVTSLQKNDSLRKELNVSKNTILVCSVGRIDKEKGFDVYIDSASKILKKKNNVKFLLIGPEDDKKLANDLKRKVDSLGLAGDFIFLGSRHDIPNILPQIDIYVLSSVTEGFSLTCLEAMACGKPVVATRCGGPEEIVIDGETGFLVDTNNPDELANAVLELINDKGLRNKISVNALERIRKFDIPNFVDQVQDLYLKITSFLINKKSTNLELISGIFSEIGSLGLKMMDQEEKLKHLENFMKQFKNNFFYRGLGKYIGNLMD